MSERPRLQLALSVLSQVAGPMEREGEAGASGKVGCLKWGRAWAALRRKGALWAVSAGGARARGAQVS